MFAEMTDGLRAPDCFHVANRPDGSVALWLEDLHGRTGSDWPVADYVPASRHFGRWQGRAVVEDRTRDDGWLSRNWLRTYLTQRDVDDEFSLTTVPGNARSSPSGSIGQTSRGCVPCELIGRCSST